MGGIGKLLSFFRTIRNGAKVSDVKIDRGGGANITCEHFAAAGDDSFPLTTDYPITTDLPRGGGEAVVGYLDPLNTPKAQEGDRRIYGRDSGTGAEIVEVWLKNDGTALMSNAAGSFVLRPDGSIEGSNGNGSFELESGGDFLVNGVIIDTAGNITSPATITGPNLVGSTSVKAVGKELGGHDHAILSGSSAPGPTGANN